MAREPDPIVVAARRRAGHKLAWLAVALVAGASAWGAGMAAARFHELLAQSGPLEVTAAATIGNGAYAGAAFATLAAFALGTAWGARLPASLFAGAAGFAALCALFATLGAGGVFGRAPFVPFAALATGLTAFAGLVGGGAARAGSFDFAGAFGFAFVAAIGPAVVFGVEAVVPVVALLVAYGVAFLAHRAGRTALASSAGLAAVSAGAWAFGAFGSYLGGAAKRPFGSHVKLQQRG
ncbi:MAG TPA: hypothetical protein VM681_09750, partial [Candidatus Thermoplasmatota archaeon]|nr:hypothetical protein [Candidatus Thermoplasmatota archaeon]